MKAIIKWVKERIGEWRDAHYYYNMSYGMYLWTEDKCGGWEQSYKEGRESQIQAIMIPPNVFNVTYEAWVRPVAMWLISKTICKWKGHSIKEDGYAGPDSGCIDATCKRCGQNWHTQLY